MCPPPIDPHVFVCVESTQWRKPVGEIAMNALSVGMDVLQCRYSVVSHEDKNIHWTSTTKKALCFFLFDSLTVGESGRPCQEF